MLPQVFYIINTLDYPFIYDLQLSVAAISVDFRITIQMLHI